MTITLHPETTDAPELQGSAPEESQEAAPAPRSALRAALRTVGNVVFWVALGALAILLALVSIGPAVATFLNQSDPVSAETILTGSMMPTYEPGDVVVVKHLKDPRGYKIGDALMFFPKSDDPEKITHRIVGVTLGNGPATVNGVVGFTTRGDANNVDDEPIVVGQAIGKVDYSVPKVGYFIEWVKPYVPLVGLAIIATALLSLIVPLIRNVVRRIRRRRASRP